MIDGRRYCPNCLNEQGLAPRIEKTAPRTCPNCKQDRSEEEALKYDEWQKKVYERSRDMCRSKAEYLCEIASLIGGNSHRIDESRLPGGDRIEMTYEVWFAFYEFIYEKCNANKEWKSLLDIIYGEIELWLMDMFAKFLSTYKK